MREVRVQLADLREDRLRLRPLRADRRIRRGGPGARRAGTPKETRAPEREEGLVASRETSCRVPFACRQARRWWGHRPQVGEPSSVIRRLHGQPSRKCSANSRDSSATVPDPVRGRARYLVPCTAHSPPRIHGRQLVRRARSRREPRVPRLGAALGRARALRRRVRACPSPSVGSATRTTPAGARREARAGATARRGGPSLARDDEREGRDPAAAPLRRGRRRPGRGHPRRQLAPRDARRDRRARARHRA